MWQNHKEESVRLVQEKTIPVYIKSIYQETPTIKRFILAPEDERELPLFGGGSHISTYVEGEMGRIIRSYSLVNDPDHQNTYEIAIRLCDNSKGGSRYWHHSMNVGDKVRISYPKNHFPLSFRAKHHVFYAAGIGITPFLSMIKELKEYGGTFELHYAAKTIDTCAFYSFLKEQYPRECQFYFSQEKESRRLNESTLFDHAIGTHIYVCGPESFITNFTDAANRIGYPTSSIHYERFTPPVVRKPLPFQVQLTSGKTINVSSEETLLEALLKAGIKAPFSCQAGRCGTCELSVIEGKVNHCDSFLSEEERDTHSSILTCVSRSVSEKLVVDC